MFGNRPLHNALQYAHAQVIDLIRKEHAHHALCWRSIHMMGHYSQLLSSVLRSAVGVLSDDEKLRLSEGLEFILHTVEGGQSEFANGFPSVSRRPLIVLSDIIDDLVDARNGFSHDIIALDRDGCYRQIDAWPLSRIDGAFRVAGDFTIAVSAAIPSTLTAPISVSPAGT